MAGPSNGKEGGGVRRVSFGLQKVSDGPWNVSGGLGKVSADHVKVSDGLEKVLEDAGKLKAGIGNVSHCLWKVPNNLKRSHVVSGRCQMDLGWCHMVPRRF